MHRNEKDIMLSYRCKNPLTMVMMVDDSIDQICPMCGDGGRIHLNTNFGNATMHNKHGEVQTMHCVWTCLR